MNEEQEEKLSKLIGYIVEEESLGDEADPNETLRYFGEVEEFVNDLIKNARLDDLNKASLGACNVAMADRDAYFYKRKQELNNSSPVEPEVSDDFGDIYKIAYPYGTKQLNEDKKLITLQKEYPGLDWDTIRDRLADAFVAGKLSQNSR